MSISLRDWLRTYPKGLSLSQHQIHVLPFAKGDPERSLKSMDGGFGELAELCLS